MRVGHGGQTAAAGFGADSIAVMTADDNHWACDGRCQRQRRLLQNGAAAEGQYGFAPPHA
jgi:hypothetical protein